MSNILYKILTENQEKVTTNLLYVSKSRYEDDWHSTIHSHPFTELFYVVNGKGNFILDQKVYSVCEDDLVIVNSNVPHTESSKDSNPLEYIVLGIEGMSLILDKGSGEDSLLQNYSIHNYRQHKNEILHYLTSLVHEVENKGEYYEKISQNLLNVLILNIVRRTKSNLVISTQKNTNKDCKYIRDYIDIHYANDITLDHLALQTYLDKYYLVHIFKKQFGITPINYLIEKRLQVSKMLLETTSYSILQISVIVGFNSQSYYCQLFKKKIGVTPVQYRKERNQKKSG